MMNIRGGNRLAERLLAFSIGAFLSFPLFFVQK